MNQRLIRHDQEEIIESIIYAFQNDALDDIRHASRRASGILSVRVLEEFSGFLFSGDVRERVRQFMDVYMPKYWGLAMYDLLKNSLGYNYSAEDDAAIAERATDGLVFPAGEEERMRIRLFIEDLAKGIRKAADALHEDDKMRQHALDWYVSHKVDRFPLPLYTDREQEKIQAYYLPILRSQPVLHQTCYKVYLYFSTRSEDNYCIYAYVYDNERERDITGIPLEILIGLLGLKPLTEVIGTEGDGSAYSKWIKDFT